MLRLLLLNVFLFVFIFISQGAFAAVGNDAGESLIRQLDQKTYLVGNLGLRDLTVEMEINVPNSQILKHPALGGKTPKFVYYWRQDGKIAAKVENVPDEPAELYAFKERARSVIEANGRYVVPAGLIEGFMGWNISVKSNKGNKILTALDKEKKVPPHMMYLSPDSRLLRMAVDVGAGSLVVHDYKYKTFMNKFLMDSVSTTTYLGKKVVNQVNLGIAYGKVSEFMLPSLVSVNTSQNGKSLIENIKFSNYRINTGLSDEIFRD